MTETFLGLRKESAASDADRAIVLGAILRPVSDAMVKDDGPPAVSLPTLAAAIASGKGGG